jgi:hypothetical protein
MSPVSPTRPSATRTSVSFGSFHGPWVCSTGGSGVIGTANLVVGAPRVSITLRP